jgi:hypothetical protein
MRMSRIAISALIACGLGAGIAVGANPPSKVTICHATGSRSNPYVVITPSAAGVVNGHLAHHDQRDIVPPFTFRGQTYSQNWTTGGRAVFSAGCHAVTGTGGGSGSGGGGGGGGTL